MPNFPGGIAQAGTQEVAAPTDTPIVGPSSSTPLMIPAPAETSIAMVGAVPLDPTLVMFKPANIPPFGLTTTGIVEAPPHEPESEAIRPLAAGIS